MAAVQNFTGLMLARFFVGFIEAVFFPGALYYMSLFYNRRQFAFRTSIMYSGSQLGNAFGGLLAIGIIKLDGVQGIQGWRWVSLFAIPNITHQKNLKCRDTIMELGMLTRPWQLFLLEGAVTVGLAILFAFILPNSPQKVKIHTELERDWVDYNFRKDQGQSDSSEETTAGKGFYLAVIDVKTWMLMGVLSTVSASIFYS